MNYGSSTFKSSSLNNNQTDEDIGVIVENLKFQTSTFGLKNGSRECEEDEDLREKV
ncbi:hypothetical protein [Methanobrevibacter sp.]|uniref:hypothetical protein n=1 Tax=Methanobrevibacter sp. TaxID=66852 RepID=UPI00386A296E